MTRVAFSPDGSKLASGTKENGVVRIWNVRDGSELLDFTGNHAEVTSLAYSPDGPLVVSGDRDGHVIVWEAESGKQRLSVKLDVGLLMRAGFTVNGHLWVCEPNGSYRVWEVKEGKEIETNRGLFTGGKFGYFVLSPNGPGLPPTLRLEELPYGTSRANARCGRVLGMPLERLPSIVSHLVLIVRCLPVLRSIRLFEFGAYKPDSGQAACGSPLRQVIDKELPLVLEARTLSPSGSTGTLESGRSNGTPTF